MDQSLNFTTGPVKIERAVTQIFGLPPLSHRSSECRSILENLRAKLCEATRAYDLIVLNGSGTLANDAMVAQISKHKTKGLILSNGEFGDRLAQQAIRQGLDFILLKKEWGESFSVDEIQREVTSQALNWILMCHMETSTGVLQDLNEISKMSQEKGIGLYVDCMSSIGNIELDLSRVNMATCSSGKGLASYPGLALVFTNVGLEADSTLPQYLDLGYYKQCNYMPFTLPSNLLHALSTSVKLIMTQEHWQRNGELSVQMNKMLSGLDLRILNKTNESSHVLTMQPEESTAVRIGNALKQEQINISYESSYLQERNCFQVALMGQHNDSEISLLYASIKRILASKRATSLLSH